MTDAELIALAEKAAQRSYSPYSHFRVGAALECADGQVYTGCNIENSAYGDTICAERTAAVKAVSEGSKEFVRIAVWGSGDDYCTPCGSCRQVLFEFAPRLEVLCARGDDRYVSYHLSDLLPHAFGPESLE